MTIEEITAERDLLARTVERQGKELARIKPVYEGRFIDVVFDGPPSHESGRFVEVENERGEGVSVGEWIDRGDGMWALRIRRF